MTQLPSKELQRLASKGPSLKPRIYFSSDRDEGFREAEFAYAHAHFMWNRHAKLDEQREALNDLEKPLHELLDTVDKGQRPSSKLVIDCFRSLIDYRTMPAPEVETAAQNELFKQVRRWHADARYHREGGEEIRKTARKNLKLLSLVLIPDGRGKKGNEISDWEILSFYNRTLFRLFQVRHALKANPGTFRSKITKAACDFPLYPADEEVSGVQPGSSEYFKHFYQLTEEWIRDICGLDEEYQRTLAPVDLKLMARIVTGFRFDRSEKTISNLLSD